jgi:hypothetical protein
LCWPARKARQNKEGGGQPWPGWRNGWRVASALCRAPDRGLIRGAAFPVHERSWPAAAMWCLHFDPLTALRPTPQRVMLVLPWVAGISLGLLNGRHPVARRLGPHSKAQVARLRAMTSRNAEIQLTTAFRPGVRLDAGRIAITGETHLRFIKDEEMRDRKPRQIAILQKETP